MTDCERQKVGACVWVTGLSGAGKTTLANGLARSYREEGLSVVQLDGDVLREIFDDYDYSCAGRLQLGLKFSRLVANLVSQGHLVIIAVIALFSEIHEANKKQIPNYIDVFLDVPISELCVRDSKGLYDKYLKGHTENLVGMDINTDFPVNPVVHYKWQPGDTAANTYRNIKKSLDIELVARWDLN